MEVGPSENVVHFHEDRQLQPIVELRHPPFDMVNINGCDQSTLIGGCLNPYIGGRSSPDGP